METDTVLLVRIDGSCFLRLCSDDQHLPVAYQTYLRVKWAPPKVLCLENGVRRLHVAVEKVHGMKDESNSLIRLADAVAGFVRDYFEGQPYAEELKNV